MKYTKIPHTDLKVSRVCLGTMTWGIQNNQKDADEQINYALDNDVNLVDTAEMYPVPPNADVVGNTERIIGEHFRNNPLNRDRMILMSKIAGRGVPYVRQADNIRSKYISTSIDASLKRLNTDYIDVYQLHWPNRNHPHFNKHWHGKISFDDINVEQEEEDIINILRAVEENIKAGKIKYIGISNETPWGISKYLELSKKHNLPRVISVQNEFSLVHSKDWPYVAESCAVEGLAYFPWSPLAGGALSGKYLNNARPEGTRWTMAQRHGIFRDTEHTHNAIETYNKIAIDHNMTCSQLSLAWCNSFDWVTSTIIGATKMTQLKENIEAFDIELSKEAMDKINKVIREYPMPF